MLLNFKIIWIKIGQDIRLQNDINFSEVPYVSKSSHLSCKSRLLLCWLIEMPGNSARKIKSCK